MDRLVLQRKPVRTVFTKTYNSFKTHLTEEDCDKETLNGYFAKLERLSADLSKLDDKVIELILDSEDELKYEEEFTQQEEYKDKLDMAKIKLNKYLEETSIRPNLINQESSDNMSETLIRKKLQLPKIELKKFNGEIKDWLGFWSQFKRIHEDNDIEPEDKFQYLIQAMSVGSRAKDIVDSFPPIAENYEKVIDALKNRFGREELLIEYYVRELLGLVVTNITKGKTNVSQLYDRLESHLRALESIGMTRDKYAAMLFPLVESCIPEDILRAWIRSPARNQVSLSNEENNSHQLNYSNRLQELLTFLRCEVEGEERVSMAKTGLKYFEYQGQSREKHRKQISGDIVPTANDLHVGDKYLGNNKNQVGLPISKPIVCIFCDKAHESKECFYAQKLSFDKKKELVSNKKGCYLCLKIGHRCKDCKSSVKCIVCSRKHCTIMCPTLTNNEENAKPTKNNENKTGSCRPIQNRDEECTNLTSQSYAKQVYLQTLMINIETNSNNKIVRALLDSGSQRSYILKKTATEMGFQPVEKVRLVHALFGGIKSSKNSHNCYTIQVSSLQDNFKCELDVLDQSTICGPIPRLKYGPWLEEMKIKNIVPVDLGECQPEIELLIGADMLGKLLTGRVEKFNCGLVTVETLLGWAVMGSMAQNTDYHETCGTAVTTLFIQTGSIADLWSLDVLGITDPYRNKTKEEMELAALQHFNNTVTKNCEGRYEVTLPWVESQEKLVNNRDVAEKRLKSTTTKLIKEGRFQDYDQVFKTWEQLGVIKEYKHEGQIDKGHYLPHRAVIKENSTTKVRPVFDASSKTKGCLSLNDCLEKGPNLIEMIPTMLLRFREKRIGITSDIEKAFLQISVKESDCNFLKFLWWENYEEGVIKVFQHQRVVFGVNCSPFILGAVIAWHLDNCPTELKNIADKLKKSFYVDNCVTSVDSQDELQRFIKEATDLMSIGQFNLRDWNYSFNNDICTVNKPVGVLGLLWDINKDQLFCDLSKVDYFDEPVTRRIILSTVQKVFDPIGFTCPATLYPKVLLQESWKAKLSWDEEVSKEMKDKFLKWKNELRYLENLRIPRCAVLRDSKVTLTLHTFCDASKTAFSAVVFLRSENRDMVSVQLMVAKTRVAPLKEMTIPRLELMACCIGTRLAAAVKDSINLNDVPQYYWTDSTTALYWIRKEEECWGTFVQNRVLEIRKLTNGSWLHVPGELNPADLPSRGCTIPALIKSQWWEGPAWLKTQEQYWPKSDLCFNKGDIYAERKKQKDIILSNTVEEGIVWYLTYFSKYSKVLRMIAWMLRFIGNSRKSCKDRIRNELSVAEINKAEKLLLKEVQKEAFSGTNKMLLKNICTFKDDSGILRVKTKIMEKSNETFNFRCPAVLPCKHKLVNMLIMDEHIRMSHAGLNIIITKLRESFWIIKARQTIRRVISSCIVCRRYSAKHVTTPPVTLPANRVMEAAVFEVCGVDLAGPLILKNGDKAWITIYTCAVYRAIHLELIMSLSTNGFFLGFRRFIARRGRPKIIYSDNGTNFVGADNLFKNIDWENVDKQSTISRIQWIFIPPTAAWWGGWWERIVRTVKDILKRVLGKATLNYDELSSIICDCEAVVNSRPLTYVSDDTDNIEPITPAMFLHENRESRVIDLDIVDTNNLSKKFKYQQKLRENLRRRFRSEYLTQLVQKPNKKNFEYQLNIGDVVLLGSDVKKRLDWPIAKVINMYPGRDGVFRVVKLKTATTELIRPVQRVYPLEVRGDDPNLTVNKTEIKQKTTRPKKCESQVSVQKIFKTSSGRLVKLPSKMLEFEH